MQFSKKTILKIQRQILTTKGRMEHELFPVEGPKVADALLKSDICPEWALISSDYQDGLIKNLITKLESKGIPLIELSPSEFKKVCDAGTPQGISLAVKIPKDKYNGHIPSLLTSTSPGSETLWVLTAGVQDPGNIGAIIRCAGALGAAGVICAGGADPYGPKSVRASAGALFKIPVVYTGVSKLDNYSFLELLIQNNWEIAAAGLNGCSPSEIFRLRKKPLILAMGSEGEGLPVEVSDKADYKVYIPISDGVESLNVAVACGIILSHLIQ